MISRRAYSYAPATRDVFIEIPAEDGEHDGSMAGKLYLSFYGTQDAAANWQETRSAPLASIGFTRGKCYQSIFCHKEERISTLVHGDDYVSSGHPRDLAWLRGELEKAYEIQTQLVGSGDGAVAEGKVLNRILRWHAHGWELEADPRHCELVIGQLGLGNSKGLSALGNLDNDPDNSDDGVELSGQDVTRFRGLATRLNYLAMDRSDIQFYSNEICRDMSRPTRGPYVDGIIWPGTLLRCHERCGSLPTNYDLELSWSMSTPILRGAGVLARVRREAVLAGDLTP